MPNIEAAQLGDKLAVRERASDWGRAPHVTHSFFVVNKVMRTQLTAVKEGTKYELRFRRTDGGQIGATFARHSTTAAIATPELIAEHEQETAARQRYLDALERLRAVEQAIDKRDLTVEQMEAIATAYEATLPEVTA